MTYHILPESEPFSEHVGGACSRWVANVVRQSDNVRILCPFADTTWGMARNLIHEIPKLRRYNRLNRLNRLLKGPLAFELRVRLMRNVLAFLKATLKPGDIVYIHNRPEFAIAVGAICERTGARLILHLQNSHLLNVPRKRLENTRLDAVIYCSEFLKGESQSLMPHVEKHMVIPNGANDKLFFPEKTFDAYKEKPLVLFVGRLVPDKGVHVFLDAFRILQSRNVPILGKIIGGVAFGSDDASRYVRSLRTKIPPNVELLKYMSGKELARQYRESDIFCCPSVWNEPFGMVNVEAMASGLPVIASRTGGIPEIFQDGGGILVTRDSPVELAAALETLATDSGRRKQLAALAYASFKKNYRWSKIRELYLGAISVCDDHLAIPLNSHPSVSLL